MSAVIDENKQADNVPLESLHWSALKKKVEDAGGKYEGKDKAIEFLSGGKTDAEPEANPEPAAMVAGVGVQLDKSMPYGTVCGDIEDAPGARYFQNGHYFNAKGEKVG